MFGSWLLRLFLKLIEVMLEQLQVKSQLQGKVQRALLFFSVHSLSHVPTSPFVTIDEPILIHHYPKLGVYLRNGYSGCCFSVGLDKCIIKCIHLSVSYRTVWAKNPLCSAWSLLLDPSLWQSLIFLMFLLFGLFQNVDEIIQQHGILSDWLLSLGNMHLTFLKWSHFFLK